MANRYYVNEEKTIEIDLKEVVGINKNLVHKNGSFGYSDIIFVYFKGGATMEIDVENIGGNFNELRKQWEDYNYQELEKSMPGIDSIEYLRYQAERMRLKKEIKAYKEEEKAKREAKRLAKLAKKEQEK